jgi:hypothetical protein
MRKINIHNKLFFALFAFFAAKDAVNIFSAPQRLCGKQIIQFSDVISP